MEHRFSYPQVVEVRRGAARRACPAFPKPVQQVLIEPSQSRRPQRAPDHHAWRVDTEGDR